jgi:hypothetical protein
VEGVVEDDDDFELLLHDAATITDATIRQTVTYPFGFDLTNAARRFDLTGPPSSLIRDIER